MDPSKNNSFDSSGSGEKNPDSAGTPLNAGAVNPPVAGVTSQNSSPAGPSAVVSSRPAVAPISNSAVAKPASSTGAFAPGAYRPMSARPMNPGMMPTAPIASGGTGDIVLSKDTGGNKSKKWWIIGGVVGALLVVILVVFAIINNGGFGGARATDLRSAFNIYANYFLTGEAKDEDIASEDESEEDITVDMEAAIDPDVENVVVDVLDTDDDDNDENNESWRSSYFYDNVGYDDNGETDYTKNIVNYFDSFYQYYNDVLGENEFAEELIEKYNGRFRLVLAYQSGVDLSQSSIFDVYKADGKDAALRFVEKNTSLFEELETIDGVSFYKLANDYGIKSVELIESYERKGCFSGELVDYDCVEANSDASIAALENLISGYYDEMTEMLERSERDLYESLFDLKSMVENAVIDDDYIVEEEQEEDE